MSELEPPDLPRDFPDKIIRQTLQHPQNLREFLARVLPDHVDRFDFSQVVSLPREFLSADWRGREADLLFTIPYHDPQGREQTCLIEILIEHQSAPDPSTVLRSLLYAASSWEGAWLDWKKSHGRGEELRLRTIVCIVLSTGAGAWNTAQSLDELIDGPEDLSKFGPRLSPIIWELRRQSVESLLTALGAWPKMLAVMRAGGFGSDEFERVFVEALRGLEPLAGAERLRWLELVRVVMMWMIRTRPDPERGHLTQLAVESQNQAEDRRELKTMYETIYEAAVKQGRKEGVDLGRKEGVDLGRREGIDLGRKEGIDLGRVAVLRSNILRYVEKRLGGCPEGFQARVHEIQNVPTLETLFDELLDLTAAEDLGGLIARFANSQKTDDRSVPGASGD